MAINIPSQLRILTAKATLDERYGPHVSLQAALNFIKTPNALRSKGLTFAVISGSTLTEYWWETDGLTDAGVSIKNEGVSLTATEVKSLYEGNSNTNAFTDLEKQSVAQVANKVDKVSGKGLSTNDYTLLEKNSVATIVDKVDKVTGKVLSSNDYTTTEKTSVSTIADKVDKVTGKSLSTNDYTAAAAAEVAKVVNKEDGLGNPTVDGDILSSTIAGVRAWVTAPTGSSGSDLFANSVVITTLAGLTSSASAGKIMVVQASITLTANATLPTNATIYDGGGQININGFTLTGNNTGIVFFNDKVFIDAIVTNSKIAGTWKLPQAFSIKNLGAIDDGYDNLIEDETKNVGTASVNLTDLVTLTDLNANFTGRQGQQIAVVNADKTKDRFGLKTTIQSVISPTQITLAKAVTNVGEKYNGGGTGAKNDLSVAGVYTGTKDVDIIVEIQANGTPDTFRWRYKTNSTYEAQNVAITGASQTLINGITISFASTTGHKITEPIDSWEVNGFALNATRAFFGTDNKWAIQTALHLRNKQSGTLIFPEGHYMSETEEPQEFSRLDPVSWIVGDGTDEITLDMTGAVIQSFPTNFVKGFLKKKTYMFYLYDIDGLTWNGGTLVGEYFTAQEHTEYPAGYNVASGVRNAVFNNVTVQEFHGDGAIASADGQNSGYIKGTDPSVSQNSVESRVAYGYIADDGVTITPSTTWVNSVTGIDVYSNEWQKQVRLMEYREMTIGNGSFQGWSGLMRDYYYAYYYGEGGNFLFKSPRLYIYEKYKIREDVRTVRLMFPDVTDAQKIDLQISPDLSAENITFNNCHWLYNGRQGFSNPPQNNITFRGGTVMNNGDISPGAGFDFEDKRRLSRNVLIDGMTFKNNYVGDLLFIGTQNIKIVNCTFLNKDRKDWGGRLAIRSELGRDMIISNNTFFDMGVSLGRNDLFSNNKMNNTFITTSGEGSTVLDNDLYNTNIKIYALESGTGEDIIKGNIFRIDRNLGYLFSDLFVAGEWTDNKVYLNDVTRMSNFAVAGVDTKVQITDDFQMWEFAAIRNPRLNGYINGLDIEGANLTDRNNNPDNYNRPVLYNKIIGLHNDLGVNFHYGYNENKLIEDMKSSFVNFRVEGFPTSIPADPVLNPANTITIKDSEYKVKEGELDWSSNINAKLFKTDKYVNFDIYNTDFIINDPYTVSLTRSRYIQLGNNGTTRFTECYFSNAGAQTDSDNLDLTNYWITNGAGPITFVDCDFDGDLMLPKLRTQDVLIDYRKPFYFANSTNIRMSSPGGSLYTGVNTATQYTVINVRDSGTAQVRFNTTVIPNITAGVDENGTTVPVTFVNPDIFVANTPMDMALENENGQIYVYLLKR